MGRRDRKKIYKEFEEIFLPHILKAANTLDENEFDKYGDQLLESYPSLLERLSLYGGLELYYEKIKKEMKKDSSLEALLPKIKYLSEKVYADLTGE